MKKLLAALLVLMLPVSSGAVTFFNAKFRSGIIDSTTIGVTTPAYGRFTTLIATDNATFEENATVKNGYYFFFGDSQYYGCGYYATGQNTLCTTALTEAASDDYPMFWLRANSGDSTMNDEQVVFGVGIGSSTDNVVFKVDEDGDVTASGEVTAAQFVSTCSSASNNCGVVAANDGNNASPVDGLCNYNKGTNSWNCYNGSTWDSWGAGSATPKPFSFVIKAPTTSDDFFAFKADRAITITQIDCITDTGTVDIRFQECGADGTSCSNIDDADLQCDSNQASDSSIGTNADVDTNDWVKLLVQATASSPGFVSITVRYSE